MREAAVRTGRAEQARLEGRRVVSHRPRTSRQPRRLCLMPVSMPIDTASAGILPAPPAPACNRCMRGIIRRRRASVALTNAVAETRERPVVERRVGREMLDLRVVPIRVRRLIGRLGRRQVGRERVAVRVGREVWVRVGVCARCWRGMLMWLLPVGCRGLVRVVLMLQRDRLRVVMLERRGWLLHSVCLWLRLRERGRLLIPIGRLSVRL